ncbi:MAG TPA: hypothetical protein VFO76_12075 [Candidatus Kapabacteria bacterium]|nr:hypothetical protein [Candidatus Kapabacteria bacterium]
MIRYSVILCCCIGMLFSASASLAQQNHSKSKLNAEQLHKLIDSLSKELESLEEDESVFTDTSAFGNLFGGLKGLDLFPQMDLENIPSPLLLNIQPLPWNNAPFPNLPNPPMQQFHLKPMPVPRDGTPIPDFPGWRIELLKYIYQRV